MVKFWKVFGILLGCIAAGLGLLYLIVTFYYRSRFMPNTTINLKNAYTLTVSRMNEELVGENKDYTLKLQLQDGEEILSGSSFDFQPDYTRSLQEILARQKCYEWPWYFVHPTYYEADPDVSYDEGKLLSLLSGMDCYNQDETNAHAVVRLENRMNHFTFRDDRKDVLNIAKATEDIFRVLEQCGTDCDLRSDYDAPKATAAQQKELDRWEKINQVQNAVITYVDDELSLQVDRHDYASWIVVDDKNMPVFDAEGKVTFDPDKMQAFLMRLSDTFNTDHKDRTWKKYKGGIAQIPSNEKGYIVDEEAEAEELKKIIRNGWKQQRKPIYSQEGKGHGNAEVGDTYVEVDLGNQKLYYIENGKLALQTDVVTGCKRYHNDTPSMITDIYFMQEGRTLRGENYATFVYYWMAFYNHYGLHDATWRSKFGGDIYLTDGSHGCVNMPKDKAAELYQMVHVGTPVILYE